jgi:hypothetical protein
MAKGKTQKPANGSNLDFEAQPWAVADKMCGHMEAAWKLARMNPAISGFDADLGLHNADSFQADLRPNLKADVILANPPFKMSDWSGENLRQDVRWKYGMPPVNNANYAWMQHFSRTQSCPAAILCDTLLPKLLNEGTPVTAHSIINEGNLCQTTYLY